MGDHRVDEGADAEGGDDVGNEASAFGHDAGDDQGGGEQYPEVVRTTSFEQFARRSGLIGCFLGGNRGNFGAFVCFFLFNDGEAPGKEADSLQHGWYEEGLQEARECLSFHRSRLFAWFDS